MLEVSTVTKAFGRREAPALDRVSFGVRQGRICGLLGHNGAGKSTALGVILGMVHPDEGEVAIGGASVQRHRETAIRKVGAIFETPVFYEYLSGWRNLKILSAYSGGVSRELMDETVHWVGLTDRIRDRVGTYSHGMRQRLALAQALLPRPELLVLDEPTDGLDPEGIVEFRRQLLELRERLGLTVLLSSHQLSEAEQLCDEVVILQNGTKVYEGKVRGVSDDGAVYEIESENPEALRKLCLRLGGKPAGPDFSFPSEVSASEILRRLVEGGAKISRFAAKSDTLEALYLTFSQGGGSRPDEPR
ncbi:MAG: ABC transporter ATP-binding protein [Verrucomicrobiales bacterium]